MQPAARVEIEIWRPGSGDPAADLEMLGRILHACVHGGASVSFILPFSTADATAFWREKVLPQVRAGTCRMLVARIGGRIEGTVQLDMATPANQPHRAEVRKLLVDPDARRHGIARRLMTAIEQEARAAGRTLLTLDTHTGSSAESLYVSMGYVKIGVIPGFSVAADSPALEAATFFYKQLA